MDGWGIGVGFAATIALMIFSALNLALRMPSRMRLGEQFEARRRGGDFERFVAIRPQYMLATAVLRSFFTLVLLFTALRCVDSSDSAPGNALTVLACALALALVLIFGVAIPNAGSG